MTQIFKVDSVDNNVYSLSSEEQSIKVELDEEIDDVLFIGEEVEING